MSDDRDYLFMGEQPDRLDRARVYVAYREGPAPPDVEPAKLWCVCRHGQKWCTPEKCDHKQIDHPR